MNCKFTFEKENKRKKYQISKSYIEQEYGPIEEGNFVFYTAGSRGKVISLTTHPKFMHQTKKKTDTLRKIKSL